MWTTPRLLTSSENIQTADDFQRELSKQMHNHIGPLFGRSRKVKLWLSSAKMPFLFIYLFSDIKIKAEKYLTPEEKKQEKTRKKLEEEKRLAGEVRCNSNVVLLFQTWNKPFCVFSHPYFNTQNMHLQFILNKCQ